MAYEITQYLLDRANIHDVVTKMSLYLDMSRWDDLHHEVFANTMTVDYASVLGGEPYETSGFDQAKQWESLIAHLTSWQHITTSLLVELPQPGDKPVPESAKVIANCSVTMRRVSAEGDKLTRNGGRYIIEVARTETDKVNPWRITFLKADLLWRSGNEEVLPRSET